MVSAGVLGPHEQLDPIFPGAPPARASWRVGIRSSPQGDRYGSKGGEPRPGGARLSRYSGRYWWLDRRELSRQGSTR